MKHSLDIRTPKMNALKWLGLVAVFSLPTLFMFGSFLASAPPLENDWIGWLGKGKRWQALVLDLSRWYFWIPLTPWIVNLGRRLPLLAEGSLQARNLALHGLFSILASFLGKLFELVTAVILFGSAVLESLVRPSQLWSWLMSWDEVAVYWLLLVASLAWGFYWQAHERKRQLTEARMTTLKAQIHPHFLFNTLHSVSALMDDDVPAARKTTERLIDLLQASLTEPSGDEVTLEDELHLARHYLEIEHVRFADRLDVQFDIAAASREALVPHLLLQPLVENAIRHGIGKRSEASLVRVSSTIEKSSLCINVEDDGPGLAEGSTRDGIGLGNAKARLQQLYGGAASLDLEARPDGGCRCAVRLPLRRREGVL